MTGADNSPQRPSITVADGDGQVQVRKLVSKRGERAEITTGDDRITLDALLLESLSWQRSLDDLATLLDDGTPVTEDPTPITGGDPVPDSEAFQISNEYAQATLSHVRTAAGDGVRVATHARGSETTLGVPTLRAMAAHADTFAFSEFFNTPVGPEDTPLEGPH